MQTMNLPNHYYKQLQRMSYLDKRATLNIFTNGIFHCLEDKYNNKEYLANLEKVDVEYESYVSDMNVLMA